MKCVVSVLGKDRSGIVAEVATALAACGANIDDISQTILREFFTMTMLVDTSAATVPFARLQEDMAALGQDKGLDIRVQQEEIFNAMHRI